jgi:hypothetical protein
VYACYKLTEEQYALAHPCGSFGSWFWPLCYRLDHCLPREFNRDEAVQHAFARQRGSLPGTLRSRLVLASSVLAPLLVMGITQ